MDNNLFYSVETIDKAKAVCLACPVRIECLCDAMVYEPGSGQDVDTFGIWGGATPRQRSALRVRTKRGKQPLMCEMCGTEPLDQIAFLDDNVRYCDACVASRKAIRRHPQQPALLLH